MEIIIDDKIKLQLLNPSHAQEIFDLVSDGKEYLNQWLSWAESSNSIKDTLDYIKASQKQLKEESSIHFSIFNKQNIIGTVGFNTIDKINSLGIIGYWLGQEHQSKGYMTKSVEALIRYSFEELGLNRVEIRCAEGNLKSQGIPIRLGFSKGRVIKDAELVNGRKLNHVVYELIK